MATARAAVVSTASLLRSSDAAKPHAPSAITRSPMPSDSASEALPILPFFVASARLRSAPMRTSAYLAPRNAAVSRAHAAMCFIVEIQFNIATQLTPCDPLPSRSACTRLRNSQVISPERFVVYPFPVTLSVVLITQDEEANLAKTIE